MKRSDFLNGKIKPEFGNLEQIKMIKEIQESDKSFKEGVEPTIKARFQIEQQCHCQESILYFEAVGDSDQCLVGEKANCEKCKRKYIISTIKIPHWLTEMPQDVVIIKYAK